MSLPKPLSEMPDEDALKRAVHLDPEDPSERNRLGDRLFAQGQLEAATREFQRAGVRYLRREQYPQAVATLKKAFRIAPQDPVLADLLVQACRFANRPQAAAEVFFTLSSRLVAAGDGKGAYQLFARGVAENPGNTQRKARLAAWARQLGKLDRAADLYLELAEFWGQKLDLDRAFGFLHDARSLRNGPKAMLVELRILALSGRNGEASALAERALARFPNHAGLRRWMDQASERSVPSPRVDRLPSNAVLARLRANLLQARNWHVQGYLGRALSLIQRMLLADPGFLPALELAEQIHHQSGHTSRFQRLCISCAQRLLAQGRHPEALACLDRTERLFPGSTAAYRSTLEEQSRLLASNS